MNNWTLTNDLHLWDVVTMPVTQDLQINYSCFYDTREEKANVKFEFEIISFWLQNNGKMNQPQEKN
jgi:hypothetical protein